MSTSPPLVVADRYRLVAPLGQGGMGRVWRATDVVLHRDVAIKELVPPPGLTVEERQEMRERSLREARAIARLNHINVVRIFDVLRTDADPWIVMEYVPSRSLQDALAADGPYPASRAAEIGLGVLGALRSAHRAGVVHRDVKPGNVLIGEDGRVVLTDFGLATVPGDPNVTRTGLVLGSPAYIAPERARDGTAGPAADLWSLGATLYAAVEGASPFARPSAIATLAALATESPPPARNAGPLKPVLNGLLRKDPAHRINADEAERLLLRATGRRSKISFPMSPTMRRPGLGRERPSAPVAPPVVPGAPTVSGSAPVVPGPRPPVSSGRPPATPPGAGRPPVYVPGKASVGQPAAAVAPVQPVRDTPTRVDTPAVADPPEARPAPLDATRVDTPAVPADDPAAARASRPDRAAPPAPAAFAPPAGSPAPAVAEPSPTTPAMPAVPATQDDPAVRDDAGRVGATPAGALRDDAVDDSVQDPFTGTRSAEAGEATDGAGQAATKQAGAAQSGTGAPSATAPADAAPPTSASVDAAESQAGAPDGARSGDAGAPAQSSATSRAERTDSAAGAATAEPGTSTAGAAAGSAPGGSGSAPSAGTPEQGSASNPPAASADATGTASGPVGTGARPVRNKIKGKSSRAKASGKATGAKGGRAAAAGSAATGPTAGGSTAAAGSAQADARGARAGETNSDAAATPATVVEAATAMAVPAATESAAAKSAAAESPAADGSAADGSAAGDDAAGTESAGVAAAVTRGADAAAEPAGTAVSGTLPRAAATTSTTSAPVPSAPPAAAGTVAAGAASSPGRGAAGRKAKPVTPAVARSTSQDRPTSPAPTALATAAGATQAGATQMSATQVGATQAGAGSGSGGQVAGVAPFSGAPVGSGRPPWRPMPVRAPSTGKAGVTIFGTTLDRRQTYILVAFVAAVVLALVLLLPKAFGSDDPAGTGDAGRPTGGATAGTSAGPASAAPGVPAPVPSATPSTASSTPTSAPASPASPTPRTSAPAGNGGFRLPAGWRMHSDSTGFAVPVPDGWSVRRQGTEVYFEERAQSRRLLIVDQTRRPKPDPVADWKNQERARKGDYRDYRRIKIDFVSYWDRAADWEFTRTSDRGNALHVVKRGFITAPDQAYGITWSTSAADWNASLDDLDVIYRGFKPARS